MTFLVTFADGHSTLVASREAAEQIAAYWPQLRATIRDLDQEARDREEMIGLLETWVNGQKCIPCGRCETCLTYDLLKRLGRLP